MGPRAGLYGRKISSPSEFDPGPSSPQSVAIPTELPGPSLFKRIGSNGRVKRNVKYISVVRRHAAMFNRANFLCGNCMRKKSHENYRGKFRVIITGYSIYAGCVFTFQH